MGDGELIVAIAGMIFTGLLILVPLLLLHQRKMAEIMRPKEQDNSDLLRRIDALSQAVYELAAREDRRIAQTIRGNRDMESDEVTAPPTLRV